MDEFDWDADNLRKIAAHGLTQDEVEEAILNDAILVWEQDADGEMRFLYYSETPSSRAIAIVLTEREARVREITAYELDAGQYKDYMRWRYGKKARN